MLSLISSLHKNLWLLNKSRPSFSERLLFLSLLFGLAFRLQWLYQRDFWFDEAFTYHIAKLPLVQVIPAVLTDNNPPLYYLFMHFMVSFTWSPVLLRLPSLLFNLGAMIFLYKIVYLLKNQRPAIYTTIFFLLSPLTIYLSSSARLHGVGLFFTTLIVWVFLRLNEKPTHLRKIQFIIFAILGLYAQYYIALLFVPLSILATKASSGLSLKSWLKILAIIFGAFSLWVGVALVHTHAACLCPPSYLALPATLVSPILGGIGEVTVRQYGELPWLSVIFFGVVVTFNLFLFWKGLYKNHFLALLYIVPLILISIAGSVAPLFTPKGFAIYSPFFIVLAAVGIASLKNSNWLVLVNVLFLLVINIIQITNPFFSGTPIRPIVDVAKSIPHLPIAHISSITYFSSTFYLPDQTQILLSTSPYSEKTTNYIGGKRTLEMKETRYWLVDTKSWVNSDERQSQLEQIYGDFEITKEITFPEVSIKLIERK